MSLGLQSDLEQRIIHADTVYNGTINSLSKETTQKIQNMLKTSFQFNYVVSDFDHTLKKVVDNNDVIIVAGGFFGDESKGKIVDALAHHPDVEIIYRANSGENAGHTIFNNGVKYVFHLAPSGLLIPDKINIIGPDTVMDPINFFEKEILKLIENKIDYKTKLYVDDVSIVTPYHKLMDLIANPKNSSTLQGMSPAHASKVSKTILRLSDLYSPRDNQYKKIERDIEKYYAFSNHKHMDNSSIKILCEEINNKTKGRIPDYILEFLSYSKKEDQINFLIDFYQNTVVNNVEFPTFTNTSKLVNNALQNGKKVVGEGAQSYFLSNKISTHFSSSTSADTTAFGTASSMDYNISKYKTAVINVTKMPGSRVGLGQNPSALVPQDFFSSRNVDNLTDLGNACEDFNAITKQLFDSIDSNGILKPTIYEDSTGKYLIGEAAEIAWAKQFGEFGATTKKPRILGFYDLVHQHELIQKQGPHTAISAFDRFDNCDNIGLVIGYVYFNPNCDETRVAEGNYRNGDLIKVGDKLPNEKVLKYCQKIVKVFDAWPDNPIGADKNKGKIKLHRNLQNVLSEIEFRTGSNIVAIGNGPNTNDMIYLRKVN